jgi:hypothetical protein
MLVRGVLGEDGLGRLEDSRASRQEIWYLKGVS